MSKHQARAKAARILSAIEKGPLNPDQIAERDELCARLGIFRETGNHNHPKAPKISLVGLPLRDIELWAMIGIKLAASEPEFRKKRGRGRKSLEEEGEPGIDYERTKHIRAVRREMVAKGVSASEVTNEALVDAAVQGRHQLFRHADRYSLVASVARGNSLWSELERQSIAKRASWLRLTIEEMRKRAAWVEQANYALRRLDEIGPQRPLGILSYLDESARERRELFWLLDHPPYRSF